MLRDHVLSVQNGERADITLIDHDLSQRSVGLLGVCCNEIRLFNQWYEKPSHFQPTCDIVRFNGECGRHLHGVPGQNTEVRKEQTAITARNEQLVSLFRTALSHTKNIPMIF